MGPFSPIPAVIAFSFDPIASIGSLSVRLETIGVAVAILLALLLALVIARWTPIDASLPVGAPLPDPDAGFNRLRPDDLLFIAVAALPGAVVGARLGYWHIHLDYYRANPGALLDVTQGGLQLSLGVVGGIVTASLVAWLLGAPLARWLHALTLPLLFALAAGKAAMVLGGSGQGTLWDGQWATAYLGDGPWGSLGPAFPSVPAQAVEATATLAVLVVMWWALAFGLFRRRSGSAFFTGLAMWAVVRLLVASTWRDPEVFRGLRVDQIMSLTIVGGCLLALILIAWRDVPSGDRSATEAIDVDATGSGTAPG